MTFWADLYGERFAVDQVEVERGRRGLYDYESAWNWALSDFVNMVPE
jgi:hypothetical protein